MPVATLGVPTGAIPGNENNMDANGGNKNAAMGTRCFSRSKQKNAGEDGDESRYGDAENTGISGVIIPIAMRRRALLSRVQDTKPMAALRIQVYSDLWKLCPSDELSVQRLFFRFMPHSLASTC